MSQGMDDKIRQISEMLSSPDAQDGIRNLFSSLGTRGNVPTQADLQDYEAGDAGVPSYSAPLQASRDTDWINYIQNMLGQMSNVQDSRINLLRSVHPFLNPTRRERCATCMNILKVASLLRAMTNSNGRLF